MCWLSSKKHLGCFPTKILLLYIKINNQSVCKTFFQADTFTVSIVTNDLWLNPFGMHGSMHNKINVVDYVLQPFWMFSYQHFVALHNNYQPGCLQNIFSGRYLYYVYCHQRFMTESILYEWKHVQQNICSGLSSTAIWDVFLPKFCSST